MIKHTNDHVLKRAKTLHTDAKCVQKEKKPNEKHGYSDFLLHL